MKKRPLILLTIRQCWPLDSNLHRRIVFATFRKASQFVQTDPFAANALRKCFMQMLYPNALCKFAQTASTLRKSSPIRANKFAFATNALRKFVQTSHLQQMVCAKAVQFAQSSRFVANASHKFAQTDSFAANDLRKRSEICAKGHPHSIIEGVAIKNNVLCLC